MKTWIACPITLIASLVGCGVAQSPERELAWIRSANAERMFREDVRAGRIRFLVVCGISCFTPELGPITYGRCYRQYASTRTIDETGDVIVSDEHMRLKDMAGAIATAYNRRTLAYLDSTGRRHCPARAKWDELWHALGAITNSVPRHPYVTSILAYSVRQNGADFQLHVPDPVDLTPSLKARLCSVVPRFGVDTIQFRVTTGDINDNPHEERPFACHGRIVAA